LGPAARRSALRANRRLARAEKAEQVNAVTESEEILRRAEAGQHLHHDRA
jgi:hypothetical protein